MQFVSIFKYDSVKESNVKLAKKGDKKAFERLIEENKISMYRVAKGILNSEEDIEDAFQNTIINAYENIINLKKDKYFKTWFIRILINECNKILRNYKKVISIEEISYEGEHTDSYLNLEITNAINSLCDDLRVVTILFYFEDMAQKDIAKILEIPEGTVRSRLSRARTRLYEIMKED